MEEELECVEITHIYGARCVPRVSTLPSLCSHVLTFRLVCRSLHRFSRIPRSRTDRRNPLEEEDIHLEYDVLGIFKGERADGKPDVGDRERQWVHVDDLTGLEQWQDKVKEYEERAVALRQRAAEAAEAAAPA